MNVAVVYASRHGATREIAEAIADRFRSRHLGATVVDASEVGTFERFDAVVLGSALYMGRWMRSARALLEGRAGLRGRPVWLFSSGPVGDPSKPTEPLTEIETLMRRSGAREHKVFAGRLDRHTLSFFERAAAAAVQAKDGDFRDWAEVRAWADRIADALAGGGTTPEARLSALTAG